MNIFCASEGAVPIRATEGEAAIRHEVGCESQITSHAHGRLYRVVGNDPNNHNRIMAARPQPCFQIGPDEGAVGTLDNNALTREWRYLRLELVSWLARTIMGIRLRRVMPDMPDRPPSGAPVGEQSRDIRLGGRIISLAPTWMIDRLL